MRTDHKELSEHLMLVDLARNDPASIWYAGQMLRCRSDKS